MGAPFRDGAGGNNYGAAYIFDTTNGTNWSETADISLGPVGSANDYFGWSVALDGNRALVGTPQRDGVNSDEGAAYIFDTTDGINWSQTTDISLGPVGSSTDLFGSSVALDGNRALVGASGRDGLKGAAYIYDYERTN